ncbi:probable sodium/potassium/calcium exchanger CG1090 [Penaeus indicus]|uniref:probable sodium/potassium/calcium exchanger CG1090 n=1 Tax=Penaeus indicus TaxID=29960 RepID=UPI00300D4D4E
MGLAARLGIRTRQARLRPLLLAFVSYLGLVTLLTHGHTLLHQPLTAPSEDVSEAMSSSSSSSSRHLLQTDVWGGENCTQPAIEQFPRPLMSSAARRSGGLILHILISFYMFLGIAIVCDEYFVPSLEMICDCLQMSEDVAGATFMAAGSSAPELATSVIAVFVAKDDIGISGVIGSAVFNIMFVISVCALFAGQVIVINWWPLIRDSTFYCISICGLLLTIYNEKVNWYESVFLLLLYVLYIVMMFYNKRLETWANTLNIPFKNATREEKSSLFGTKPVPPVGEDMKTEAARIPKTQLWMDKTMSTWSRPCLFYRQQKRLVTMKVLAMEGHGPPLAKSRRRWKRRRWNLQELNPWHRKCLSLVSITRFKFSHHCTMQLRNLSEFIDYGVTNFKVILGRAQGFTLGIPDTVMGLTFIAVGVSVPDALSSLCVAKQGFGDMAVSNAIGSNVFDILLCLGLPWFLKTAIVDPGSIVPVESRGLTYSTVSLFSTVVFLIVATHMNGWKLDKKYGIVLMFWYLIFMVFASLYELNVFGYFNPPECESSY